MGRRRKIDPELAAKYAAQDAARAVMLDAVRAAIAAGTAKLATAWGPRKVTGYNHQSGWAFTKNDGEREGRSFMVCLDSIQLS